MDKRSRLRAEGDRRRRLFILVLLILAGAGVIMWLTNVYRPHLIEQFREEWGLGPWISDAEDILVRGTIYDRNYKELAVSYERVSVYANIREIDDLKGVVAPLAKILEEPEQTLYERLSGNTLRLWLAKDVSQEQEEKIRKLGLSGVSFHKEHVRYDPQGKSGAHLLGFVENDSGLAGVEYFLDQLQTRYRLNSEKIKDLNQIADGRPGSDGQHLILTLDLKIQKTIDRFLKKYSESSSDTRVGVLVMEAGSGALIGYSQVPSFDPNRFHTFSKSVFRDIFDTPVAVPESFKVFLRELSLLESQLEGKSISLPWSSVADKRKLGVQLQLWDALGAGAGAKYDFINSQLMNSLNNNLAAAGTDGRDFETVPTMLTPLELLTAVGRVVNGGNKIIPHAGNRYIVRKNQEEYLLKDLKPEIKGNILKERISEEALLLFEAMGQENLLKSSTLYGKSSTYHRDSKTSFRRTGLSITLVPAREPELILMMVTEAPGYSADKKSEVNLAYRMDDLIAPVSALQQVMKNLADMMKPKEREEKNFQNAEDQESGFFGRGSNRADHYLVITKMPDLRGMSLRKSLRLLQAAGAEIQVEGTGRIVAHKPLAGAALVSGSKVVLTLERDKVELEKQEVKDTKQ